MARYAVAGRSSVVGTSARGQWSLYSVASRTGKVREVGIFNTTTTAVAEALVRFTATGTQGNAMTEVEYDETANAPQMTAFEGHTADATVGDIIRRITLGAAIGAGLIWTFGDTGLVIAAGTTNGIGTTIPTGSGQIIDFHCDWDE